MKELNLETATMEELTTYREVTASQLKENEGSYSQRFSNFPSQYGNSINDEYNG